MKNKKGFTLVELLAVIVILALIMAIAIYSISGVLQGSRESTFKETALSIISGVRMQLTTSNELKDGTYYFSANLLENDNDLPFGGKINYTDEGGTVVPGTNNILRRDTKKAVDSTNCTQSSSSYVTVNYDTTNNKYEFSICLTPANPDSTSQRFIRGTESALFGNTTQTVFPIEISE